MRLFIIVAVIIALAGCWDTTIKRVPSEYNDKEVQAPVNTEKRQMAQMMEFAHTNRQQSLILASRYGKLTDPSDRKIIDSFSYLVSVDIVGCREGVMSNCMNAVQDSMTMRSWVEKYNKAE